MKADQNAHRIFILDRLRKGQERKEILQQFAKAYKVGTKTFDSRLKEVRVQYANEVRTINEKAEEGIAKEVEALKSKIMTSVERQVYLSEIANCKSDIKKLGNQFFQIVELSDGRKEFISQADKLKAIAELNKMGGDYAPKQVEQNTEVNGGITISWQDPNP